MRASTREWLANLIVDKNNSKAIEIREYILALEGALTEAKAFSEWVECLGRTDCEVYKHELKGNADLSIERIGKALEVTK